MPFPKSLQRFWEDRDGAILPYVAIMLVVIFGLSALAIDASRLMSVQTQLQNAADALALPANCGTGGNPYAEFLGLVKRSDLQSSDMVQLYR
jgi:uncharacterized membrane protein